MLKEAIILAGGLGTRLRDVVTDLPKSMAPVNDIPFLDYVLRFLSHYKIKKITLAVGYMSDRIVAHYGKTYNYSIEKEPLGTGGAIRLAIEKCHSKDVLVLNGDSFFDFNLNSFYNMHCTFHSDCSLAVRKVPDASRYGTIKSGTGSTIKAFREKDGLAKEGFISAGVYLLDREKFLSKTPKEKPFSVEKDFFEKKINELNIFGFTYDGYFIDIGIPADFEKAQHDFKEFKY